MLIHTLVQTDDVKTNARVLVYTWSCRDCHTLNIRIIFSAAYNRDMFYCHGSCLILTKHRTQSKQQLRVSFLVFVSAYSNWLPDCSPGIKSKEVFIEQPPPNFKFSKFSCPSARLGLLFVRKDGCWWLNCLDLLLIKSAAKAWTWKVSKSSWCVNDSGGEPSTLSL